MAAHRWRRHGVGSGSATAVVALAWQRIGGGDKLDGVLSAREFVVWYNGHPEFGCVGDVVGRCLRGGQLTGGAGGYDDGDDISPARVVVVGQGNVTLDVSRILVKGGCGLVKMDALSSVLDILGGGAAARQRLGRSGHEQVGFTIKFGPKDTRALKLN